MVGSYFYTQVRASQALLEVVGDLKQRVVLEDGKAAYASMDSHRKQVMATTRRTRAAIMSLRNDVASLLHDVEEEYFKPFM